MTARRTRLLASAAAAVLVLVSVFRPIAASASTDDSRFVGATGAVNCNLNQADNESNSWFGYYLETQTASAMHWALDYIENETVIDEVPDSTRDSLTDVIYNDGDYDTQSGPPCVPNSSWYPNGGVIGATACYSVTSGDRCQQHRIYISRDFVYRSASTPGWDQALLLHESSHGLGITHTSASSSDEIMSPAQQKVNYMRPHVKALINNGY